MGMLDGKVALITGGSRGQGRAHAVTCAREGADVIIVDIADQMATVPYKMATPDDLDETVKQVEAYDRRALAIKADVRDQRQLDEAVARGIAEFGKIDILIANAGIWTQAPFWELHRRPVGRDDRGQPDRRVEVGQGGRAAHDRARQRVDRDHLLDQRLGGRAELRALRRGQARRHRADEEHRARTGPVRHPVQLDQPRRDQDADDRPPGRLGHVRRAPRAAPRRT